MAKYPRGKVKETVWIDRDCVRTLVISNASLQPRSIEHDERMGIVIERIIGMRLEGVRQNEVSVSLWRVIADSFSRITTRPRAFQTVERGIACSTERCTTRRVRISKLSEFECILDRRRSVVKLYTKSAGYINPFVLPCQDYHILHWSPGAQ